MMTTTQTDDGSLSKTEQAYAILEEAIVTLEFPPGSSLTEQQLCLRTGMGRTPVREALQRLAQEHLIEIIPRRGIRVTDINVTKQLRLLEVRRELELLQVRLAARRANPQQRQRFAEIAEAMLEAAEHDDELAFVRLDKEFNQRVSTATDNEFAVASMKQFHGLSRRFWHRYYHQQGDLREAARLHADVALAIAEGEERKAQEAITRHMDYLFDFTLETLKD